MTTRLFGVKLLTRPPGALLSKLVIHLGRIPDSGSHQRRLASLVLGTFMPEFPEYPRLICFQFQPSVTGHVIRLHVRKNAKLSLSHPLFLPLLAYFHVRKGHKG